LGGLWALEWAWHSTETNLRCVRTSGIRTPSLNSLAPIVSEISAFIRTDRRTDGQTNMARSTQLVILIKNIYTVWGRKRFLLPVTYFPTNLVYPFTLRVTGIINKIAFICIFIRTHICICTLFIPCSSIQRLMSTQSLQKAHY